MIHPFLLAEAGGGATVPVIILLVALVGFGWRTSSSAPASAAAPRNADIPLAMRPVPLGRGARDHRDGAGDGVGRRARGVRLAVPAAVLADRADRINNAVDDFYAQDVAAGRAEYQNACASCHGVNLEGGSAPHPDPDVDAPWPAPALDNIVARYQDSEIVEDVASSSG
jgi:mono/diheme cytochrome c family protein